MMNTLKRTNDNAIISSIEAELNKNGYLVYTNTGDSMHPLIRKYGDLVVIHKVTGPLKRYDVPLYKRKDGKYIMHRVLKVNTDGSYVTCGDNRRNKEYGITDKDVLGVLYSIIRKGKEIKVTDFSYRLYVHLWCDFFFVRKFILFLKDLFKKRVV